MGMNSFLQYTTEKRSLIINIMRFAILSIGGVTMVFPLLWMLTCALKSNTSILSIPPEWIPREFVWSNFVIGLEHINFWQRFVNTTVIAVLSTVGQVLSSVMVGYALARLSFPGRKIWFYLIIGSMMLPPLVGLIPLFRLYTALGWYNTWYPLIIPNFFGSPFYIFLVRQFLMTIPSSFDEAAKIVGANHMQVLYKVLIPMIKPAITVIVIMQLQASWNDYLNPLVYIYDDDKWTLSLAVAQYIGEYAVEWNKFMAADIVYMLPMIILFFAAQRYFMKGLGSLNFSGLK